MFDRMKQQSLQRAKQLDVSLFPRRTRSVRSLSLAIRRQSPRALILEYKRRSPSVGLFVDLPELPEMITRHMESGATALSILTEPTLFGGSIQDMQLASQLCDLPILRKDFLVHPLQVLEAYAYGADAILLIMALVSDEEASRMMELACEYGLAVLVECHDKSDLMRAKKLQPQIIGINNRNLQTLAVDCSTVTQLMGDIPNDVLFVAESGYSMDTVAELPDRVDAVLMGTAVLVAL